VRKGKGWVTDGPWSGLSKGGVVLADMDLIERSNLNRQLLFREKHVGLAKCVVAAECIKQVGDTVTAKRQSNNEFSAVSLQM
jgi:ubiquitin-activating enzyme E1